jgi:hypothetical protein
MLDGIIDNKNIGLLKNLNWLRQELDVYCLISVNASSIKNRGIGKSFFGFVQKSCINLIALNICKIYEYEKNYELNSIEGVLKYIIRENPSGLNTSCIKKFVERYGHSAKEGEELSGLLTTVADFRKKYHKELEVFKTYRDKAVAHSEFEFDMNSIPSYDVMENLFNFGLDFYALVTTSYVSTGSVTVIPYNLNSNRKVKVGLKRLLKELGIKDIKTEMI